jgi:hypothetical protein
LALKRRNTPKLKAFSKKKGQKSGTLRILGEKFIKKAGLSRF